MNITELAGQFIGIMRKLKAMIYLFLKRIGVHEVYFNSNQCNVDIYSYLKFLF